MNSHRGRQKWIRLIGVLVLIMAGLSLATPLVTAANCYYYSDSIGYICSADNERAVLTPLPLIERRLVAEADYEAYAKVHNHTRVYPEANINAAPLYDLGAGFVFVNMTAVLDELIEESSFQQWYRLDSGRYIRAEAIEREVTPSRFQGRYFAEPPARPFGWMVSGVRASRQPGGPPDRSLPFMGRYRTFEVYGAAEAADGWIWYDVGNGAWIKQTSVSLVDPKPAPAGVGEGQQWVEVDLYEQSFAAYQGQRLVYAGLISSGLGRTPTREGLFRVWSRHTKAKMSGFPDQPEYYYLHSVPHIMYFDGSIGLHGAYWHDRFGFRASRGCVNMAPQDAEWLFNWSAGAGAPLSVWVHTSNPRHYFDRYQ
jgi:hypothetical protein